MPTHSINTIDDAWRVVRRYGLHDWLGSHADNLESLACWLYQRTRRVSTEEVVGYLRAYMDARTAAGPHSADFDAANVRDAEDAMSGYRHYEKGISDLMWLVRSERTRQLGRDAWSTVAALAVVRDKASVIDSQSREVLVEVRRVLQALAQLRLSVCPIRYVPGADEVTDTFMFADLERLDETLSDDALWRDEENLIRPTEISALARLAEDKSVLATLEAKLAGVLVMPAAREEGVDVQELAQ